MKKAPHGLFYLIPVGLLVIGVTLGVIFFYTAVVTPLMNIETITMNQSNEFEFSEGSFVSLFIADDELEEYEIIPYEDTYVIRYVSDGDQYLIELDIMNLDSDTPTDGFHVSELNPSSTYTFDDYLNFGDIKFDEASTFRIRLISYDDLPGTFGYAYSDYDDAASKLLIATLGISIGTGGALISFTALMILRGKARKQQNELAE